MDRVIGSDRLFSERDRDQICARGMTIEQIEEQLTTFQHGIPFARLNRPCTLGDGILQLNDTEMESYAAVVQKAISAGRAMKFVPASGAASRMFKSLLAYQDETAPPHLPPSHEAHGIAPQQQALIQFIQEIHRFAFYQDLRSVMAHRGLDLETLLEQGHYRPILDHLLTSKGLQYAKLPKALLKFHQYPDCARTPIEEHLVEAAAYTKDAKHDARVHFTVSPEHHEAVTQHIETIRPSLERSGLHYLVSCSAQTSITDTLAVDPQNQPFRDHQGQLLFRPAGHGALLNNLNDLQADLVFIKNIDNVVPDRLKEDIYRYIRALGGLLVSWQHVAFDYLTMLTEQDVTEKHLSEISDFAVSNLSFVLPHDWLEQPPSVRQKLLVAQLNRPLRVCGMVKNVGDPGGGPFWVDHADRSGSLQIVESSQVDPGSESQQALLAASTHFNPVTMVCGVRDFRGQPFDLKRFTDPHTGFISTKSYEGRVLKALELPGLWNGGMAQWNTVFVEIPYSTFNPVKTVNDLLKPRHQPK